MQCRTWYSGENIIEMTTVLLEEFCFDLFMLLTDWTDFFELEIFHNNLTHKASVFGIL